MKKVLIISYFYPPANFVGAQRTAAWAKYLHEYGYYPIVVTRQWNEGQTDLVDRVTNNKLEVEKNETHEVHRLPYRYSVRDRLANYPALKPLQKVLTLKELFFSNYSLKHLPFSNFYNYCKKLIQGDPEIKIIIASGRPFQSFFIGHQVKKDFPKIHWVPDYRDKWNTRSNLDNTNFIRKKIISLESKSEKKWISNATFFTSVSISWVKSIEKFTLIPGKVVQNGFDSFQITGNDKKVNSSTLSILYIGSVYDYQDFTILFEALKKINKLFTGEIRFTFLGSYSNSMELNKLENKSHEFKEFISILPKVSKEEVNKYISQNDVLFLTEYKDLTGCLPVKIFDYFNSEKPILLCPSDNGLMESFIKKTHSGYIANSVQECLFVIEQLIQLKKNQKPLIGPRNRENAHFYSRKFQTKMLASFLDELD